MRIFFYLSLTVAIAAFFFKQNDKYQAKRTPLSKTSLNCISEIKEILDENPNHQIRIDDFYNSLDPIVQKSSSYEYELITSDRQFIDEAKSDNSFPKIELRTFEEALEKTERDFIARYQRKVTKWIPNESPPFTQHFLDPRPEDLFEVLVYNDKVNQNKTDFSKWLNKLGEQSKKAIISKIKSIKENGQMTNIAAVSQAAFKYKGLILFEIKFSTGAGPRVFFIQPKPNQIIILTHCLKQSGKTAQTNAIKAATPKAELIFQ